MRLRSLIASAGGQTPFIRRVWPRHDSRKHVGKVGRWYRGESGISETEADRVASVFGRNGLWLRTGRDPEFVGVTRPTATLFEDVAAYVQSQLPQLTPELPWPKEMDSAWVDGRRFMDDALRVLVRDLRDDWRKDNERIAAEERAHRRRTAVEDALGLRQAFGQIPGKVPAGISKWKRK